MASQETPLVVVRTAVQNADRQVLLVRRHPLAKYNPDLLEFPGGQIEEGEFLEDAQIREMQEETGYLIRPTSQLALIGSRIILEGEQAGRWYTMFCGTGEVIGGELALSQEHTEALWTPPSLEIAPTWEITRETMTAAQRLGKLLLK